MIKRINEKTISGQTALILILLTAATLIFLAITLNWGRVAQTKALLTVAADQSASLLASETASYGEMQKQTYLNDKNNLTALTGILFAIIMVVIAIVIAVITWGTGSSASAILINEILLVTSAAMATLSLVLQLVVVQPGITELWNKLQQNQPSQQRFYEQGVSTALQSAVTDQVQISDYFDSNANGIYGLNPATGNNTALDNISRFAFFYTDRLKMLDKLLPPIPQVVLFYNQLGELMNGETCGENASDVSLNLGVAPDPACAALDCATVPSDPVCQEKIPGSFQLNDSCTASNPLNTSSYNPYCDPCCQPLSLNGKALRPSSCADQSATPAQCLTNNPYGAPYYFLYDPSFQNYTDGVSFLDQYGRDQQMGPFTNLTPDVMSPNGVTPISEFPNGIYPFFWLMNDYSPEVDNINPSLGPLNPSQYHWCTTAVVPPIPGAPAGFADLAQLNLPYSCSGPDCCVNYISTSINNASTVVSNPVTITLTGGPVVAITSPASGSYFAAGSGGNITITASEPGGTITNVSLYDQNTTTLITSFSAPPYTYSAAGIAVGTYALYAVATDSNGVSGTSAIVTINVIQAPTVTITAPPGGALTAGSNVTITASTTVSPGDSISSVSFYNGATLLGTVNASPYSYSWNNIAAGSYSLTAVATDVNGLTSAPSAAVTGTIS